MAILTRLLRQFIHHLGNLLRFVKMSYLRAAGVQIGRNTMVSLGAKIDVRRGMVRIGNDCHITYGVVILSHDGAARQIDPDDNGEGAVTIGNKVFVGVNAVVLKGVTIGDNSVIAAGAVVSSDVPKNVVVAGNPARIMREIKLAPGNGTSP